MSYTHFDRHANMNEDTRFEILGLIKEVRFSDADIDSSTLFNLENMLYGLFDGYLYENLQMYALELPTELASKVTRIYDICNKYPKTIPFLYN